jgi:hypothetical protein
MPRDLTRTELKKQRLEETRAKYPITFETAYAKLYGRDDVAKAISNKQEISDRARWLNKKSF